jgi:hypothetical protein
MISLGSKLTKVRPKPHPGPESHPDLTSLIIQSAHLPLSFQFHLQYSKPWHFGPEEKLVLLAFLQSLTGRVREGM